MARKSPRRLGEPPVDGGVGALVRLLEDTKAGVREALQHLDRPVRRPVVDDDQLEVAPLLPRARTLRPPPRRNRG